jgi:hypothetical protein
MPTAQVPTDFIVRYEPFPGKVPRSLGSLGMKVGPHG